jgi:hypothetical protein
MQPNLERKQTWHRLDFVIDLYVQNVKMCQRGNEMGRRVCQTPGPWRTPALELSTIPTSPSARQARLCHPDPLPAPLRPPKASRTASALGSTTGPSSRFTGRRRRPLTPGMPPSTREPSPSTSPACRRSPPRPASPNTAARCPAWRSDPCPSPPDAAPLPLWPVDFQRTQLRAALSGAGRCVVFVPNLLASALPPATAIRPAERGFLLWWTEAFPITLRRFLPFRLPSAESSCVRPALGSTPHQPAACVLSSLVGCENSLPRRRLLHARLRTAAPAAGGARRGAAESSCYFLPPG